MRPGRKGDLRSEAKSEDLPLSGNGLAPRHRAPQLTSSPTPIGTTFAKLPQNSWRENHADSKQGLPMNSKQGFPTNSIQGFPMNSKQGFPMNSKQGFLMNLKQGFPTNSKQGFPTNPKQNLGFSFKAKSQLQFQSKFSASKPKANSRRKFKAGSAKQATRPTGEFAVTMGTVSRGFSSQP
ncbi:uncharacterized protein LOC134770842 [Penaeus indicus]|uniref:uncharacterized protein LOC134770842 n=1 Tax=Penaeus indicus TaxID=29960 RepID=UPI00300D1A9D